MTKDPPRVANENRVGPAATPDDRAQASPHGLESLLRQLDKIRRDLLALEAEFDAPLVATHPDYARSAVNLIHYLALRRHDMRQLQEHLAALGLSSLGRTESHVLAGVEAVLTILRQLANRQDDVAGPRATPLRFAEGKTLLERHTEALLGPRPARRGVRIMVTMPGDAAQDYPFVRALLAQGMNCMRINCAHDAPDAWAGMVANLRRAQQELGVACEILMDVAGPKLRTGPIDAQTQVLKWRPRRDLTGRVTAPASVWLAPSDCPGPPPDVADASLLVPHTFLEIAHTGDRLRFTDLRGKQRLLTLGSGHAGGRWASAIQTAYLRAGAVVQLTHIPRAKAGTRCAVPAEVGPPPADRAFILLKPGDTLDLVRNPVAGTPAVYDDDDALVSPARIGCTLTRAFDKARPNETIWFDDGKIGGVIEAVEANVVRVRITSAKPTGDRLRADKGINLPDTTLEIPALTDKDRQDLAFVAQHADLVGLSFVRRPEDVLALYDELARLNAQHLGVVLKIETRTAFERLPGLMLAAMRGPRVGVMIARGDLAVECGWERMAEVQEEILWFSEAAHIPVIWATQVLEGLAKKGVPSRAEITDAAMGERAECVMLNKGPHLLQAVRVLDDILHRMEAHQTKKSARLRSLRLSTLTAP